MDRRFVAYCLALVAVATVGSRPSPAADADRPPKDREFSLHYVARVTGLPPGQAARVWLPVPPSNDDQEVRVTGWSTPGESQLSVEPEHGNTILYTTATADAKGVAAVAVDYHVLRREVVGDSRAKAVPQREIELSMKANAKVPIGGKPLTLLAEHKLPEDQLQAARVLYDVVNKHMRYSKEGTGWGNGDALWACDSRYGNCTDFHSLFMSLARSNGIPARFEIGFPLPPQRGKGALTSYHCWAKFKPEGHGWIPVDISEANKNPMMTEYYFGNLTEDRVTFSVGRDLTLVPKQSGPPLNFFLHPYIEVDGKQLPLDRIVREISFADIDKNPATRKEHD